MKKNKVLINLILIILVIGAFSQSLATEGTNEVVPEPPQMEEVAPPQNETETPDNNQGGNNEIENTTPDTTPDNTTPPNNNEEQLPEKDDTQNGVTPPQQNEPDNRTPPEQNEQETVKPDNDNEHLETPNTNNQEEKSDNANLSVMDIAVGYLSPEFNKNTTWYELIVDLSVEDLEINAVAEDKKASVSISGNTGLQEGENTIYIVVTAEAGNTKTYTIKVTKTNDIELLNAKLKTLNIQNFNIYPSFKPNIYNYNLTITEKIENLEVIAETENENAKFEITGNTGLQEGENIIKITVTAEDGVTVREYKINVFISSKDVTAQEQSITEPIILLIVLGTAVLVIGIIIIKKNR